MTLRKLEKDELYRLVHKLRAAEQFDAVRNYALAYYGENAYKAEIETYSEYNDEGGYYQVIRGITVSDKDGKELEPDLTLPVWKDDQEALVEYEDGEARMEYAIELLNDNDAWQDYGVVAPEEDEEYILDSPPAEASITLYIEEKESEVALV